MSTRRWQIAISSAAIARDLPEACGRRFDDRCDAHQDQSMVRTGRGPARNISLALLAENKGVDKAIAER